MTLFQVAALLYRSDNRLGGLDGKQKDFCLIRELNYGLPAHILLPMARQPLVGLDLLYEVPRSHSDTPHSV